MKPNFHKGSLQTEQTPLTEASKTIEYVIPGKIDSTKATSVVAAAMPAACITILAVECCERLAFYTFTGTQEFFLEKLGYSVAQAGGINAAMGTLCMAWAFAGGWIADVVLGRFHTITTFGIIYALGAVLAASASWPGVNSATVYMVAMMLLIPIGTAGIKANISNFGADQYDTSDPAQALAQEKFFSWFYMSINVGSAVAYGYLTTLGSSGGPGVPKEYGYFAAYIIAAICMLIAVILFYSNRSTYKTQPTQRASSLGTVVNRVSSVAGKGNPEAKIVCLGAVLLTMSVVLSVAQAVGPQTAFSGILVKAAFACSAIGATAVVLPCRNPRWMRSDTIMDGNIAEVPSSIAEDFSDQDVQDYLRLLPLLIMGNFAFSALYNSMQFWYQQQACQMDLRLAGTQLSGSFFTIADCLGIAFATPLALMWVDPWLNRKLNGRFTTSAKFGLGMAFAALSVLLAARLELYRKERPALSETSNCAPPGIAMSAMSGSWMVLPFFFMGLGEIYTQPILMHFSYTQSPKSMRTLAAATGLVIGAVSNAIFTAQVAVLAAFVPNDLNQGHLEYGYYSNIVLGGVCFIAFMKCVKDFEDKSYRD